MIKKFTPILIVFLIIFTLIFPINTYGLTKDYAGHWAEETIDSWINKGYITGYRDGSIKPENLITRAEFIKMTNAVFGLSNTTYIAFEDVNESDWYFKDIQTAVSEGYATGISDTLFGPNDSITREQASIMLSKLLDLGLNPAFTEMFVDNDNISYWARDYVGSLAKNNLIEGYADNTFKPQNPIKRAEAIELLNRAISIFNTKDLTIDEPGAVLENKTVNNLHITQKVGDGEVTLKNVTVAGELLIEGGGLNSIIIKDSNINKLIANKVDGKLKILAEGTSSIDDTIAKYPVIIEQNKLTGKGFKEITLYENSSIEFNLDKKTSLSSDNKNVATITKNGVLTATKKGEAIISTTIKGKKTELFKINVVDPTEKTFKILAIGNSFSQDALFYLNEIAESAGINIIIGNLYNSGCSLERHWKYAITNDKVAYTYYKWIDGNMFEIKNKSMKDVILDEDWDYITFQQSSKDSGIYNTYQPFLINLLNYVKSISTNPSVKFALNMTWAYANNSLNENFINYNYNQSTMYKKILEAYQQIASDVGINIIIPCGTAIQNARTNKYLNNNQNDLTTDGYHLNNIGRYIAALTYFESIIVNQENINIDLYKNVTFVPPVKDADKLEKLAKKAAKQAVTEPFKITVVK